MKADRAALKVEALGMGMSFQDGGRVGLRRFGVPRSGMMDDHAGEWANRLLDNPEHSPLLEILLQGAELRALDDIWIAITGADADVNVETWRAVALKAGEVVRFKGNRAGIWNYVAIETGFDVELQFGSASLYSRGHLGSVIERGTELFRNQERHFKLEPGVSGRLVPWDERRDYESPPVLKVWPGPQWNWFSAAERKRFFSQAWEISPQSDRVGYRLRGQSIAGNERDLVSEPVRIGSIQIPGNGEPIVTMRDGPTVGGYPKIGLLDWEDLSWISQCRPGQSVRFRIAEE